MGAENQVGKGVDKGRNGAEWVGSISSSSNYIYSNNTGGKSNKSDTWQMAQTATSTAELWNKMSACGCEWVSNCFDQNRKPWAVKTEIKTLQKKEQKHKQETAAATTLTKGETLLHFWRALQFKVAVSQSVMKWNTPATSNKSPALKNYNHKNKEKKQYNTTSTSFSICSYEFIACPETLWNFDRNRNFFVFCFVAEVQNKCCLKNK